MDFSNIFNTYQNMFSQDNSTEVNSDVISIEHLIQVIRNHITYLLSDENCFEFNKQLKLFSSLYGNMDISNVRELLIDKSFLITCLDEIRLKFELKSNNFVKTFYLIPSGLINQVKNKNPDTQFYDRNNI